jgi:hypothetical protein
MRHTVRAAGPWEYYCRKVKIGHPSECWEWQGSCGNPGYGNWFHALYGLPKAGTAHRRAYMLFNGPITAEVVICHKCNNRRCCNPDHLYAGTHTTNAADRRLHGTTKNPPIHKGSKQWKSKLTEKQVIEIKTSLREGVPSASIARVYNVSPWAIYRIKHGKNWAWL